MRVLRLAVLLLAASIVADAPAQVRRRAVSHPAPAIDQTFDFRSGAEGWEAGFADYVPGEAAGLRLESGVAPLPAELGTGTAFMIQGENHPDDLFMFLRRRLGPGDGIEPGRSYTLEYRIELASDAPSGCAGIGGSPGESVWLKAGASPVRPEPLLGSGPSLRMNVDKGEQASGGRDAGIVGTIGNGSEDCTHPVWRSLVRHYLHPQPVTASPAGELWLIVGTDSGFEGLTRLYYQSITARLRPRQGT